MKLQVCVCLAVATVCAAANIYDGHLEGSRYPYRSDRWQAHRRPDVYSPASRWGQQSTPQQQWGQRRSQQPTDDRSWDRRWTASRQSTETDDSRESGGWAARRRSAADGHRHLTHSQVAALYGGHSAPEPRRLPADLPGALGSRWQRRRTAARGDRYPTYRGDRYPTYRGHRLRTASDDSDERSRDGARTRDDSDERSRDGARTRDDSDERSRDGARTRDDSDERSRDGARTRDDSDERSRDGARTRDDSAELRGVDADDSDPRDDHPSGDDSEEHGVIAAVRRGLVIQPEVTHYQRRQLQTAQPEVPYWARRQLQTARQHQHQQRQLELSGRGWAADSDERHRLARQQAARRAAMYYGRGGWDEDSDDSDDSDD